MQKKNLVYDQLNEHEKEIHDFELPPAYYQYDLKGTVVHHGTADAGHYYSYIQERDGQEKWFEFNDSYVGEYDQSNLQSDTFGGPYDKSKDHAYAKMNKGMFR